MSDPGNIKAVSLVLGIETSCDETAAAVVARDGIRHGRILSNVVRSQWEEHRAFGGVVPEIAARAHVECLDEIIAEAMRGAGVTFSDLDAVAATAGPGLIGGLIVGVITAKAIALATGQPLRRRQSPGGPCAHRRTHRRPAAALSDAARVRRPYARRCWCEDVGDYVRLSTTIDDALGEAFDKTAKLLGLPLSRRARRREGRPAGQCQPASTFPVR